MVIKRERTNIDEEDVIAGHRDHIAFKSAYTPRMVGRQIG